MTSKRILILVTIVAMAMAMAMARSGLALHLVPQAISVNGNAITLQVPSDMRLEFLAELNGARFLTIGPTNELIVGSNGPGVFRLGPPYASVENLVNISSRSHSVAYRDGKLYIAARDGVYKGNYSGLAASLSPGDLTKIIDLPTEGHSSRTIVIGPAGTLYISIGISGNCSNEYLAGTTPDYPPVKRRGGVWRLDESDATPMLAPYSSGLRNPIGIAFRPADGQLWATNAGPDNLGYDEPPEVFSRLSQDSWHGMPWFQFSNGSFVEGQCINADTTPRPANEAIAPSITFDARSTPQGIAFVSGNSLGDEFEGNALVAIHGSWATDPLRGGGVETRRPPKVVMVKFLGANPVSVEEVITGFQRPNGDRFARPSGVMMGLDGHFYFTSDGGEVQGLFRLRKFEHNPMESLIAPIMLILDE